MHSILPQLRGVLPPPARVHGGLRAPGAGAGAGAAAGVGAAAAARAGARAHAARYHAPVTVPRVLLLVVLATTGCLENLNQRKYFDKLQAAAPGLAERVHRHRDGIEQQLGAALRGQAHAEPTHIGYWGETWDVVRTVTDGERLFMRGRLFHAQGPASSYYLAFTVADDGAVEVLDARVFSPRGSS